MRKVIGLLGLATIAFVIANVHFGVVADNVVEGAGTARLDVLRLADPGCTIPEMEKEIQETGTAFCLGEKGTWGAADIFLLFWGILIVTAGRFRMPSDPRLAKRIRRVMFISGTVLFSLALLDRFELLPTSANSSSISDIIPLPLDAWMVQILFAIIGALLMRGPKFELSEFEQNYQRLENDREKERRVQQVFNEKARSMSASREGVARRSRLLDRDAHLVPFRTRNSPKVRATCPFCKGGGCKECRMTGVV
ncbi:MAG: hypothetical protein VX778_02450 [Candidatus Thermoplasmatota archaeon]|nr:hypothetical protein [Candidatus Thermoplasmatota archaeon]